MWGLNKKSNGYHGNEAVYNASGLRWKLRKEGSFATSAEKNDYTKRKTQHYQSRNTRVEKENTVIRYFQCVIPRLVDFICMNDIFWTINKFIDVLNQSGFSFETDFLKLTHRLFLLSTAHFQYFLCNSVQQ